MRSCQSQFRSHDICRLRGEQELLLSGTANLALSIRHATLMIVHNTPYICNIINYDFFPCRRRAPFHDLHDHRSTQSLITPSAALRAVSAQSFMTDQLPTRRNGSRNMERRHDLHMKWVWALRPYQPSGIFPGVASRPDMIARCAMQKD